MKKLTVPLLALSLLAGSLGAAETLYNNAECWRYEGDKEKPVCADGVFTLKGMVHLFGKDLVTVEPGKRYSVTAEIRNPKEEELSGICLAVVFVKGNGELVHSREYLAMPGTETVLDTPTGMADTILTVKANPKWEKHKHWAYGVAFDAKEDESDLPNAKVSTAITDFKPDGDNIKVTLSKPLYAEFPAGTKVRLHHYGSFYLPCPKEAWYNFADKEWKTIGGAVKLPANAKKFRPAIIYYDNTTPPLKYFEMRNFKLTVEQAMPTQKEIPKWATNDD